MAYRDQRFIGVVDAGSILSTNFIIGSGNLASGSNLIADVNISSGDETLIRPGQIIFSVAGAVPAGTAVQSVNEDYTQITLTQQATSNAASDTFGLSTPSGSYLFQSASFNDPNNDLNVNSISGSDSGSNFAIVGVAKRNNSTVKNRFHLYQVSEVVQRNIGSSEISFFVEWGEEGLESDSGDTLQTAEREVAIIDLTDTGSIAPGFSLGVAGMESLKAGSEYAGYNIAINQYLSDLSGSGGGGTTATGSFTGSFTGSLLGDVLGTASISDFATTASYISTASFADTATTASLALEAITASLALQATSASYAETASYAFSASVEITKEVSSSLADTASFAQSGDGAFSGVFSGSNYSTEFTFDGDTLIVSGNVFVEGTLDAATKNFKIQHPTMEGYYLLHSSLEGPERGIYHRGKLKTSDVIHLPDYWKDLPVDDTDITVQLTPIGNACHHFVKSVSREEIEVGCECGKPHCFYIVHAQRYNEGKFEILQPKREKSL
tara:strand:- start:3757 stop:5247 length:1491 start_codon:yes stop_codon:yes gene_type:complete